MTPVTIPADELVAARNAVTYRQGILDGLHRSLIGNGAQRGLLHASIDAAYAALDAARAEVTALEESHD